MPLRHPAKQKIEAFWHLAIWFIYVIWAQKRILVKWPESYAIFPIIVSYILYAAIFYLTVLLLKSKLFLRKRYLPFALLFLTIWAAATYVDYLIEDVWVVKAYSMPPLNLTVGEFVLEFSFTFLNYCFYGILYFYIKQYLIEKGKVLELQNLQLHQELNLEKAQSEAKLQSQQSEILRLQKQKAEFENLSLRAKINPHFLFNTLNVFTSRVMKYDAETAQNMIDFSHLMRYSIEGEDEDGLVFIRKELENLKKLIQIHQFQSKQTIAVEYKETGEIGGKVPAQIFITLVENAFKYAVLNDPEHPIRIEVGIDGNDMLSFSVQNRKRKEKVISGGGVGMKYVESRLRQEYGDDYSLIVKDEEDDYFVKITIEI